MKAKVLTLVALFVMGVFTVLAENKTETFEVKGGDCEECKLHIEQAALSVDGVSIAVWDVESKQLEVTFDDATTTLDAIEMAVATGVNDTPNYSAEEEAFNALPDCCKYER
jgi:copper chaperone CopZ